MLNVFGEASQAPGRILERIHPVRLFACIHEFCLIRSVAPPGAPPPGALRVDILDLQHTDDLSLNLTSS